MVVLNDVGLTLEIMGFIIFLFIPIRETFNILLESAKVNKITKALDRNSVRYVGVGLIILGLIMQYSFLNTSI